MVTLNHNPDGMDMVVDYYNKTKGTKYEGCSMPGIYHKYVGHDNNRDFVTLSQSDTKAISNMISNIWFPQVMVEKHQMGATNPRYYVPPAHDPIAENIPEEIWTWIGTFGALILKDMTGDGHAGVSTHNMFDEYWPGATTTSMWKNVIGFLTEAANAKVASPLFIEPNELTVDGKGLSEYKKSTNMPYPWKGGWWRLSDLVAYEVSSVNSMLYTAAIYRKEILKVRNELCKKMVDLGKTEAPFYFILPKNQHDKSELAGIVNLLIEHGVDVFELNSDTELDGKIYYIGDIVVPLAHPYRPFIKEVMEKQEYPERHYTPGGELIKPYDIASWSLPLHRSVVCDEINSRSQKLEEVLKKIEGNYRLKTSLPENYKYAVFSADCNESYKAVFIAAGRKLNVFRTKNGFTIGNTIMPAGSFIIESCKELNEIINNLIVSPEYVNEEVSVEKYKTIFPRIALIESYFHDMDAGWTRFVLDSYHIPFTLIRPGDFEKTDFVKNFDVVIFPNEEKSILMEGKYKSGSEYYLSSYPPEYTKGIGKKGFKNLMVFSKNGGIILSWGASTALFEGVLTIEGEKETDEKEEFRLPFKNEADELKKNGFYIPGSLVRMKVTQNHPLTYGMPSETGVFYRGDPAFSTSLPTPGTDRRVIGLFPEKEVLMSGYAEKEELVGNKVGMVWIKRDKGQFVLYAFSPQFRASTQATYKLLFNALLLERL
jgi:hypothetical protein